MYFKSILKSIIKCHLIFKKFKYHFILNQNYIVVYSSISLVLIELNDIKK